MKWGKKKKKLLNHIRAYLSLAVSLYPRSVMQKKSVWGNCRQVYYQTLPIEIEVVLANPVIALASIHIPWHHRQIQSRVQDDALQRSV